MSIQVIYTEEFKNGIIEDYLLGIPIRIIEKDYHTYQGKIYNILREKNIVFVGCKKGIQHPSWKGENVTKRTALHSWIRNHKPKPLFCEECSLNKPYDLANISGEYKRDINDFEWLCRSCHMLKDGRLKRLQETSPKREIKDNLFKCCKCKEFLSRDNFDKDKSRKDGIYFRCKKCVKLLNKLYYDNKKRELKNAHSL